MSIRWRNTTPLLAVVLLAFASQASSTSKVVISLDTGSGGVAASPGPAILAQATADPVAKEKSPAWESGVNKSTPAKPDKSKTASEAGDAQGAPSAIGSLFPIGREFYGVKIPSYSGDILNSVVTADTMVRVDDEHLEMSTLVITLFGGPQEEDTLITTDRGVYDLKSESLTSRSKAFIERTDEFTMVGDRMIFNGATQQGRLVGNVHMKIYKIGENFGKP